MKISEYKFSFIAAILHPLWFAYITWGLFHTKVLHESAFNNFLYSLDSYWPYVAIAGAIFTAMSIGNREYRAGRPAKLAFWGQFLIPLAIIIILIMLFIGAYLLGTARIG